MYNKSVASVILFSVDLKISAKNFNTDFRKKSGPDGVRGVGGRGVGKV